MTDSSTHPKQAREYWAFISYRHADNKIEGRQWATWLHQALETYEVPQDLVGKPNSRGEEIPERIFPVFRDEEELPVDADLASPIYRALDHSKHLVVICSPRARQSLYVNSEIKYFKQIGKSDRVLAAMIDGEPNASIDEGKQAAGFTAADECFPEALQFEVDNDGTLTPNRTEPIAANFRLTDTEGKPAEGWTTPAAYRLALKNVGLSNREIESRVKKYAEQLNLMKLKIIAGVLGVSLGELTKRDEAYQLKKARQRQKILMGVIALLLLLILTGLYAWQATKDRQEIAEQAEQTEANLATNRKANQEQTQAVAKLDPASALLLQSVKLRQAKEYFLSRLVASRLLGFEEFDPRGRDGGQKFERMVPDDKRDFIMERIRGDGHQGWFPIWSSPAIGHHSGVIDSLAVSSDGNKLSSAGDDYIRVWDLTGGRLLRTFPRPDNFQGPMAFVSDGASLLTADKVIRIWDLEAGSPSGQLEGNDGDIKSLSVSRDENYVVAGCDQLSICVWEWPGGRLLHKFDTEEVVDLISISPDSSRLAWAARGKESTEKRVHIWNLQSGKKLKSFSGPDGGLMSLLFNSDGSQIFAGGWNGEVEVWSVDQGEKLHVLHPEGDVVRNLQLSRDGDRILTATNSMTQVWDAHSYSMLEGVPRRHQIVTSEIFSPDFKKIVGGITGRLSVFDPLKVSGTSFDGHFSPIVGVTFNRDGNIVASRDLEGGVNLWDLTTGECLRSFGGSSQPILDVHCCPDASYLMAVSSDGSVLLRNINTGDIKQKLGGLDHPDNAVFNPAGSIVAFVFGGEIHLWDRDSDSLTRVLKTGREKIGPLSFNRDGTILAGFAYSENSGNNNVILWEVNSGKRQTVINHQKRHLNSLSFNADGSQLAGGVDRGGIESGLRDEIRIWNTSNGSLEQTIETNVETVQFAPKGNQLAFSTSGGPIQIWSEQDSGYSAKEVLTNLEAGDFAFTNALAWRDDGLVLLSGSMRGKVVLWGSPLFYAEIDDYSRPSPYLLARGFDFASYLQDSWFEINLNEGSVSPASVLLKNLYSPGISFPLVNQDGMMTRIVGRLRGQP